MTITRDQLRRLVEGTWEEVARWLGAKPRLLDLPHPEQQLLFEYASRLRQAVRVASHRPEWDRLYFDASRITMQNGAVATSVDRRPPIYIDTRKLFGLPERGLRDPTTPDVAISLQVLRAAPAHLEFDEDGRPLSQRWTPLGSRVQGWLLEEHVARLDELSRRSCDGYLFVVYSNPFGRQTLVERRDVASWATWHELQPGLSHCERHFRARPVE